MIHDSASDNFIERIRERLGDRYEIARELFGGGMSRVFVAREIALDREVVIKFLPPEIAAEANRDRFRREIQMAARLTHPHIAPLFSAAEDGELLYYTMPFIRGESLRHSLAAGRRFGIDETIEILRDVADALAYAHKAGIVHRDIKPANVLREGDHAVITDFGVAKAVSFALGLDSRSSVVTTTGVAIGTPAYMAPEQIAGDVSADHRVDIYALGLLGYELLTGQAPFRGTSPQAQLAAQLTQVPAPIAVTRPDTPPVLAVLLARCLEKDADRRPPTAESVLEVLRAVSSVSGGAHYHIVTSRSRQRMAVAGVGLALAAAGTFWYVKTEPEWSTVPAVTRADTPSTAPAQVATQAGFTTAQLDSIRRVTEAATARRDARLISLLRDSISNALRRTISDSVAQVRAEELALQRQKDSVAAASSRGGSRTGMRDITTGMNQALQFVGPMPNSRSMSLAPEAFTARLKDLGPPRRVGVSIFSGVRNPQQVIAAGLLRDSIQNRLTRKSRYLAVPGDSVQGALSRSRTLDSVRTWLKADMWITIYATGEASSDSTRWEIVLRDFTAITAFNSRSAQSKRVLTTSATDQFIIAPLLERIMRELEMMDRAPRREPAPAKG